MTPSDAVDALFDVRAELVRLRVPMRAIHAVDRQLAALQRQAPVTRDDAHRAALLALDLRDRARAADDRDQDAAALLRAARLLANESRTLGG